MKAFKIRWMNKGSGNIDTGNVLTKEIDVKGGTAYRVPLNFDEAKELCEFANENYTMAQHVVAAV